MTDPCAVLKNIKSKLKVERWTNDILSNLDSMIPELQRITQSKTSSKTRSMETITSRI